MKFELCSGYEEREWDGVVVPVVQGALGELRLPCEGELRVIRIRRCSPESRVRYTALPLCGKTG